MGETTQKHLFESYSREPLHIKISRKQFFDNLRAEINMFAWRKGGEKISELGLMENMELYEIIPRILPDTKIILENQQVWAIPPGQLQRVLLFEVDPNTLMVFNQIDGTKSLREIAQSLTIAYDLPYENAFLFTRGLFLTLVTTQICLPVNNPKLG
ncbi:MAG: hypothetical protein AB9891_12995 [Anaerolineaceae bacterium]